MGFVTVGNMRANNRNKTNLGEKIVVVISVLIVALSRAREARDPTYVAPLADRRQFAKRTGSPAAFIALVERSRKIFAVGE